MLIAFHKPYGVLSQFTPEPGSKWRTLAEFGLPKSVYAIGRLDADSEGLLLFSDEPGLNSLLLDPEHGHRREYWAQVEGRPDAVAVARLEKGVDHGDDRSRQRLVDVGGEVPEALFSRGNGIAAEFLGRLHVGEDRTATFDGNLARRLPLPAGLLRLRVHARADVMLGLVNGAVVERLAVQHSRAALPMQGVDVGHQGRTRSRARRASSATSSASRLMRGCSAWARLRPAAS